MKYILIQLLFLVTTLVTNRQVWTILILLRDYSTYPKTISIDTYLREFMIIINSFPNLNNKEI